ncbi:alpha/beta-hydrolase [Boletus edulis BED1]|uniref:Alpha/beta-hydrolase n=1 Tax=Boletus edulis BED1 TaxID=1328754 RepID=A0AAD4BXE0_BOLED|nr:alpha/beta-hydrolase [Boletus edulis BED1]
MLSLVSRSAIYTVNGSGRSVQTRLAGRGFSAVSPVELEYDAYIPPNGNKSERPLVILHGFFGSKRNWQSLSKAFARDLERPVYALDLRNHGSSPHVRPMTYTHMAADVLDFCHRLSLSNISLLGHSMGGKVAMTFALDPEMPTDLLKDLIVSDIAPVHAKASTETVLHIQGMEEIEASNVSSRKDANEILEKYEKDPSVRAFLLTNLIASQSPFKFKVPIDILKEGRPEIESFRYVPGERAWSGHALFVKGSKSKFINRHNKPLMKDFFPESAIEELDTGHWIHAEMPNEFKKLVVDFVKR